MASPPDMVILALNDLKMEYTVAVERIRVYNKLTRNPDPPKNMRKRKETALRIQLLNKMLGIKINNSLNLATNDTITHPNDNTCMQMVVNLLNVCSNYMYENELIKKVMQAYRHLDDVRNSTSAFVNSFMHLHFYTQAHTNLERAIVQLINEHEKEK